MQKLDFVIEKEIKQNTIVMNVTDRTQAYHT